jgi:ferritin-like metal-binding protein YciE
MNAGPSGSQTALFYKFLIYIIMRQNSKNKSGSKSTGAGKTASVISSLKIRSDNKNNDKDQNGKAQNESGSETRGQKSDAQPSYLEKFFIDQLKDIYYAENKILEGLDKMVEAATTDELKDAFREHHMQTEKHVKRLEKVFDMLNQKPEGKKCEAIEGILKEAESIIGETEEGSMTRDAALIFAAQKVEHYEIASYGGLVQFAITLGIHEAADKLDKTLREEEDTDRLLTEIAENDINLGAEQEGVEFSWEKEDQLAE